MSKISVIEAIEKVKSLDGISSIMSSVDVINLLEQIKDSDSTFINLNDDFIEEAIIHGIEVEKYELLQRQAEAEVFEILEKK